MATGVDILAIEYQVGRWQGVDAKDRTLLLAAHRPALQAGLARYRSASPSPWRPGSIPGP